jgi:hypothetical protein
MVNLFLQCNLHFFTMLMEKIFLLRSCMTVLYSKLYTYLVQKKVVNNFQIYSVCLFSFLKYSVKYRVYTNSLYILSVFYLATSFSGQKITKPVKTLIYSTYFGRQDMISAQKTLVTVLAVNDVSSDYPWELWQDRISAL